MSQFMQFMKIRSFIVGIILLGWISSFSIQCGKRSTNSEQSGNAAFKSELKTLDGQTVTLETYRGQVTILNLWATWCGPCREEMPDLDKLNRELGNQGLAVLGISVDASIDDARTFADQVKVGYPLFWDGMEGSVVKALGGVIALPTTFIFDSQGQMVKKILGPRTFNEFKRLVTPLLRKND